MSALILKKMKYPGLCCLNKCIAPQTKVTRPSHYRAIIAGHEAGELCKPCAKAWRAAWDGANVTLRVRVDPFKGIYVLENPEVVDSAMFGPCFKGRFRMENDPTELWDEGVFRMDRMTLIEPEHEQLPLNGKVAA